MTAVILNEVMHSKKLLNYQAFIGLVPAHPSKKGRIRKRNFLT